MSNIYNLERFIYAQEPIYKNVLSELKQGKKTSHWMWYVFPQIKGLGSSLMTQKFAISSLEEAEAYLKNPILGLRLRQCTQLVLNLEGCDVEQIFSHPDNLKFQSSMTLFLYATKDNQIFKNALLMYFDGKPDPRTLEVLNNS